MEKRIDSLTTPLCKIKSSKRNKEIDPIEETESSRYLQLEAPFTKFLRTELDNFLDTNTHDIIDKKSSINFSFMMEFCSHMFSLKDFYNVYKRLEFTLISSNDYSFLIEVLAHPENFSFPDLIRIDKNEDVAVFSINQYLTEKRKERFEMNELSSLKYIQIIREDQCETRFKKVGRFLVEEI